MNVEIPSYAALVEATYKALKTLDGSGKNDEINQSAKEILDLSDRVLEEMHTNTNMTEIDYRLAWARTMLKNFGAISNSARAVWSINTDFVQIENVVGEEVEKYKNIKNVTIKNKSNVHNDINLSDDIIDDEVPDEIKGWRQTLHQVLLKMDPYGFERLTQRLLRESGFSHVEVTKKSGDGGIDGTGKLKINGIFTFNVAFQCKRYKGSVGSSDIRDFRGSLTTDIEKALFITTGTFSKQAVEEASTKGKQQIDLIDGEEFITMLAELQLGVQEVKDYQIDEEFFFNI